MASKRRSGEVAGEYGPDQTDPEVAKVLPWVTPQSAIGEPFGGHMGKRSHSQGLQKPRFTPLQGQYLAFIHTYSLVNGRPPAEADMRRYFQVTPPVVHQMILALERKGLVKRVPGQARSIQVVVAPEDLPILGLPPSRLAPSMES